MSPLQVHPAWAWLLCTCYAASLHLMALVRAMHYLKMWEESDRDAPDIHLLGQRAGVRHLLVRWWLLVVLMPVPGGACTQAGHSQSGNY